MCGFQNGHQKIMSLNEIILYAQHESTILNSTTNMLGGHIRPFNELVNRRLDNEQDYHLSSKKYEEKCVCENW